MGTLRAVVLRTYYTSSSFTFLLLRQIEQIIFLLLFSALEVFVALIELFLEARSFLQGVAL